MVAGAIALRRAGAGWAITALVVLAAAFALAFLLPAGRSDLEHPVGALEQPEAAEAGPSAFPIPVGAGATA